MIEFLAQMPTDTMTFLTMVRFLRGHGCSQGQALTLGGVAETFVALNRGPRVQTMEIWSRGRR